MISFFGFGLAVGLDFLRMMCFCVERVLISEIIEELSVLILFRMLLGIGCNKFLLFLMLIVVLLGHQFIISLATCRTLLVGVPGLDNLILVSFTRTSCLKIWRE